MNTITELRQHAGLDKPTMSRAASLADVLWRNECANEAMDDVFRILQALNIEMNGRIPSENSNREQDFPRKLIYAVTEITMLLRKSARKASEKTLKEDLNKAAWRVEVAWSAILSGDIDDLEKHVAEEEMACGD